MNIQANVYKPYRLTLQVTLAGTLTAEALNTLAGLAALLMERQHKEEFAALLAFVLQHGAVDSQIYSRAADLWLDLETELCPRVLWDARARAEETTWEMFMGEILDGDLWSLE